MSFSIKYFLIFIKARRIWTKNYTRFKPDTEVVGICSFLSFLEWNWGLSDSFPLKLNIYGRERIEQYWLNLNYTIRLTHQFGPNYSEKWKLPFFFFFSSHFFLSQLFIKEQCCSLNVCFLFDNASDRTGRELLISY